MSSKLDFPETHHDFQKSHNTYYVINLFLVEQQYRSYHLEC